MYLSRIYLYYETFFLKFRGLLLSSWGLRDRIKAHHSHYAHSILKFNKLFEKNEKFTKNYEKNVKKNGRFKKKWKNL